MKEEMGYKIIKGTTSISPRHSMGKVIYGHRGDRDTGLGSPGGED